MQPTFQPALAAMLFLLLLTTACKKTKSSEMSQTVPPSGLPALGIQVSDTPTSTVLQVEAKLVSTGASAVTAFGICFGTGAEPGLSDSVRWSPTKLPGTFTVQLKQLQLGTTYHLRAFATNAEGTNYSNELLAKTADDWLRLSSPNLGLGVIKMVLRNNRIIATRVWENSIGYSDNWGVKWTYLDNVLGAYGTSIAESGGQLLVGTFGAGVYASSDNGASWSTRNSGISNFTVTSLAVTTTSVFAGTLQNGVYASGDNGATWHALNAGLGESDISSLVANELGVFVQTPSKIYQLAVNGAAWKEATQGLDDFSWAIPPPMAGLNSKLLLTDRRSIWTYGSDGKWIKNPRSFGTDIVRFFAYGNSALFAGCFGNNTQLLKTTNAGENWWFCHRELDPCSVSAVCADGRYWYLVGSEGSLFRMPM